MDRSLSKKRIETVISRHRNWFQSNGDLIHARGSESLQQQIETATSRSLLQIPNSLSMLAMYYGIRGIVKITDRSEDGWQDLSDSVDFHAWDLLIRTHNFLHNPINDVLNLTNYISRAACLACVSEKWAKMGAWILGLASEKLDFVDKDYWSSRCFEPFVLECYALARGELASQGIPIPYSDVLENWNSLDLLSDALVSVCNYHCANVLDDRDGVRPEFAHPPFDLLPCEVMLVQRIREDKALLIPKISHPLLSILNEPRLEHARESEHKLLEMLAPVFGRLSS